MGRLLACCNVVHQLARSDMSLRSFPPVSSFQAGVRFHFLLYFKSLIMFASPLAWMERPDMTFLKVLIGND